VGTSARRGIAPGAVQPVGSRGRDPPTSVAPEDAQALGWIVGIAPRELLAWAQLLLHPSGGTPSTFPGDRLSGSQERDNPVRECPTPAGVVVATGELCVRHRVSAGDQDIPHVPYSTEQRADASRGNHGFVGSRIQVVPR